jgi:hypothetical protein
MPANNRMHVKKTAIITVVAGDNPKRKGTLSFTRFNIYRTGMSVGEYIAAGGRSGDINHDLAAGYITLTHSQSQAE